MFVTSIISVTMALLILIAPEIENLGSMGVIHSTVCLTPIEMQFRVIRPVPITAVSGCCKRLVLFEIEFWLNTAAMSTKKAAQPQMVSRPRSRANEIV